LSLSTWPVASVALTFSWLECFSKSLFRESGTEGGGWCFGLMVLTLVNLELQVTFLLGDSSCWLLDVEIVFWYCRVGGGSWWPSRLSWDPGSPSIILTQSLLIWFISSCQEYPAFLFLSNVDRKSRIKSVWSRFLEWHFLKFLCSIFLCSNSHKFHKTINQTLCVYVSLIQQIVQTAPEGGYEAALTITDWISSEQGRTLCIWSDQAAQTVRFAAPHCCCCLDE